MLAEKKDGHNEADNANAGSPDIFLPRRCFPDRLAPGQPSAPCRGQNPGALLRACSLGRTSEFGIRCVCCSSSPDPKRASDNPATRCVPAGAEPPAKWDECKAAAPRGIGPGLRSLEECCRT